MHIEFEVHDQEEAKAIKRGMADPAIWAFVKIMGTLSTLKSQRAKERVLTFVKDHFEEMEGK